MVISEVLSVHEVGDRNRVDAIRLGRLAIEHDINTAGWASTEVLLSELLNLLLNGRAGKLLGEGDLLKLHLVNSRGGGASQSGGDKQVALHFCGAAPS